MYHKSGTYLPSVPDPCKEGIGEVIKNINIMAYFRRKQYKVNKKWYPKSTTIGKPVTTKEVAKKLADLSSLSTGDVISVLNLLGGVIGDLMNQGRTVKLDGVGTFFYTIDTAGNGVDTPEEVNANQINRTRVRFIPEVERGTKGQVTTRSLVGSNVFWELLDEDLPNQAVDEGATTEPDDGDHQLG